MDPRFIGPEQWEQVSRALTYLALFAGLAVNGALAFLTAHAIIPSLAASADTPAAVGVFRLLLYPVAAVSAALMVYAIGRSLVLAVDFLQYFYPRFLV